MNPKEMNSQSSSRLKNAKKARTSMVKIGKAGSIELQFIKEGLTWALEPSYNRRDACSM
jgi:hypothetical protein